MTFTDELEPEDYWEQRNLKTEEEKISYFQTCKNEGRTYGKVKFNLDKFRNDFESYRKIENFHSQRLLRLYFSSLVKEDKTLYITKKMDRLVSDNCILSQNTQKCN